MPDQRFSGTVSQLGSRIDAVSRTLRVEATIPNNDDVIRPGTSFEVELTFTGKPYPSVREVSVLWSRDGAYLWRAVSKPGKDGTPQNRAEKVFVSIVRRDRGRILVDGPLSAEDRIIVEGVQSLRPNQRIEAIPFASFAPEEAAAGTSKKKKATQ